MNYTGCWKQSSKFLPIALKTSVRVMMPTSLSLSITGYAFGLPTFIKSASSIIERSGDTESTSRYIQSSAVADWNELAKGFLVADNVPDITAEEVEMFKKYISTLQHSMGIDELSTRLVFMSRKVLPYRFNKGLTVGEDTLQYLELKDAHERGELKLAAHNEKFPTYMYDVRISGIALKESQKDQGKGFINWMKVLLAEMDCLKDNNKLHKTRVPILEF